MFKKSDRAVPTRVVLIELGPHCAGFSNACTGAMNTRIRLTARRALGLSRTRNLGTPEPFGSVEAGRPLFKEGPCPLTVVGGASQPDGLLPLDFKTGIDR